MLVGAAPQPNIYLPIDGDVGNVTKLHREYPQVRKEHAFQNRQRVSPPPPFVVVRTNTMRRITWGARDGRTYLSTSKFLLLSVAGNVS